MDALSLTILASIGFTVLGLFWFVMHGVTAERSVETDTPEYLSKSSKEERLLSHVMEDGPVWVNCESCWKKTRPVYLTYIDGKLWMFCGDCWKDQE